MASTVKFKFKSAREYDTVSFPGTGIKLLDLKRAIVEQKRLHQGMEFDLTVVNDKTKEEYKEDTAVVTKNACVVVKRVPAPKTGGLLAKIKALDAAAALQSTATAPATASASVGKDGESSSGQPDATSKETRNNILAAAVDEDAALSNLNALANTMRNGYGNKSWSAEGGASGANRSMSFSGRGPGGSSGRPGRGSDRSAPQGMDSGGAGSSGPSGGSGRGGFFVPRGGPGPRGMGTTPPGYVCRRCFQPGHFIQDCPTNGDSSFDNNRKKRAVGIPNSMMEIAEGGERGGPGRGGGLVNASGQLVTIRANDQAFRKLKEFGGGQSIQGLLDKLSQTAPDHLKCPICNKIMSDAVILPCCHKSTCDSCVRRALASSGNMSCPLCKTRGIGPDSLLPNVSLRAAVDEYLTRVTRESRGRANKERADTEKAQEDADRLKREEDAATGSVASGGSGNKRKRIGQKGVDAILELGPRDRGAESAEEEEDADDPFGHDVYDVPANIAQNAENHSSTSGEKDPTNDSHDRGEDHHHMQGQVKQDRQHREPGPGGTGGVGFDPSSGFDNGLGLEDGPGYEGGSGRGRRFPGAIPMGGHGHPMDHGPEAQGSASDMVREQRHQRPRALSDHSFQISHDNRGFMRSGGPAPGTGGSSMSMHMDSRMNMGGGRSGGPSANMSGGGQRPVGHSMDGPNPNSMGSGMVHRSPGNIGPSSNSNMGPHNIMSRGGMGVNAAHGSSVGRPGPGPGPGPVARHLGGSGNLGNNAPGGMNPSRLSPNDNGGNSGNIGPGPRNLPPRSGGGSNMGLGAHPGMAHDGGGRGMMGPGAHGGANVVRGGGGLTAGGEMIESTQGGGSAGKKRKMSGQQGGGGGGNGGGNGGGTGMLTVPSAMSR